MADRGLLRSIIEWSHTQHTGIFELLVRGQPTAFYFQFTTRYPSIQRVPRAQGSIRSPGTAKGTAKGTTKGTAKGTTKGTAQREWCWPTSIFKSQKSVRSKAARKVSANAYAAIAALSPTRLCRLETTELRDLGSCSRRILQQQTPSIVEPVSFRVDATAAKDEVSSVGPDELREERGSNRLMSTWRPVH